ncbi:MAG TPA: hypothetical protein PKK60_01275 [archaeon]|nr:hypothetical protein [archaeon]
MAKSNVTQTKVEGVVKKEVSSTKKVAKLANKKASINKKELAKAKNIAKKEKAKNMKQDKDIEMLKAEIAKLKSKKVSRGHVSEYNIFIRKQIKSGMTFTKAAKQWSKYKSLQERDKRRPSAYNQFIGSQMRLGKTWTQAVALWKLAKAGKLGKKGSTRTVTKTVVRTRTIKSKPKIKYRTRTIQSKPKIKYRTRTLTKTIVKKVPQKAKRRKITKIVQSGNNFDAKMMREMLSSSMSSKSISREDISSMINPDDEEIAFKIVQTYFKEIARYGFKKQLTLDEIINAYFYSLARVKRKSSPEAERAVKESGMTK